MTCLEGDCPSFALVSVDPDAARPKPSSALQGLSTGDPLEDVPEPVAIVPTDEFVVRLSGIGGTGVITVSQILGTAAMLGGSTVRGLDQTGLSQKAGPVVSDVRISANGTPTSNKANSAGVDCFLAFDLLVAASDTHRTGAKAGRTIVIGSAAPTPTGAMVAQPTTPIRSSTFSPGAWPRSRSPSSTGTRTPRRSRAACSAMRRPPTSCCSALPCRPVPSRSTRRASSGRSSSTASPSNATSRRSAGAGAGTSSPRRSSRPPATLLRRTSSRSTT